MSRWIQQFENHAFKPVWEEILDVTDEVLVDDETVVTSVEEIARFKKVVNYLNSLLEACDPELIPPSTWDNYHGQCNSCLQQIKSYQSNRNIGHITNANKHLDNLLTYIRPYQVVAGKAAKSASASFVAYTKTINSKLNSFQTEASSILDTVCDYKDSASSLVSELELSNQRIKEL